MPALLTIDCLAAATPDGTPLFADLTLSIERESIGLVGRNGSGKSTLLALLSGEREPAAGTVSRAARIGVLRQVQPDAGPVAEALGIAEGLAVLQRL